MKKLFSIILLSLFTAMAFAQSGNVHIKGTLKGFKSSVVMKYQSPYKNMSGEGIEIKTDENGKFDMTINIDKPEYFKLGRNLIYLEPGFDVRMYINYGFAEGATFSGKGWAENDYLRYNVNSKGGSYCMSGIMLSGNPPLKDIIKVFEKNYKAFESKLDAYWNLSENFIAMEKSRNCLHVANSFYHYTSYASYRNGVKSREDYLKFEKKVRKETDPIFRKYIKKANLSEKHLQFGELRSMSYVFKDYFKDSQIPSFIKEYDKCNYLLANLKGRGLSNMVFKLRKETEKTLTDKKYLDIINNAFKKYESLTPGKDAPVLEITDTKGEKHSTTDFRGKMLVIDVWATWCGPCCAIAPKFHELAKEYDGNENVEFISLSVDSNKSAWMKHITKEGDLSHHYRIKNSKLSSYMVNGIPRFIIIDKEGKILDAFAPRPGRGELKKLIEEYL